MQAFISFLLFLRERHPLLTAPEASLKINYRQVRLADLNSYYKIKWKVFFFFLIIGTKMLNLMIFKNTKIDEKISYFLLVSYSTKK